MKIKDYITNSSGWFPAGLIMMITLFSCQQRETTIPQPNIIIIMADDLGYGGLGCYGNSEIKTPCLDTLAKNGLLLTDYHSNGAVCTPTRAALLTGRYQQRSGLEGVIYVRGETRKLGLDTTLVTLANILEGADYETAIFGKWHLGYQKKYNPIFNGFDHFKGYLSGNIDYQTHYDNAGIYDWYHNLDSINEPGYVTDLITRHSINFINQNKENPFFLYISHEAPHVPFQGRNDPGYRYPDIEFDYFGPVKDRKRAYREMVEIMDEGIGLVLKALEENELTGKTLVIFISDNGGLEGYGNNGNLRGAKTSLFEGGHRVPAIISWPGKIIPGISDELVMSFDLFPTIMSTCNIDLPPILQLDGKDISSVLFQNGSIGPREVFWRYRDQWAMRYGSAKLMITTEDTLLFDLTNDLPEQQNLAADSLILLREMTDKLGKWDAEMRKYEQQTW